MKTRIVIFAIISVLCLLVGISFLLHVLQTGGVPEQFASSFSGGIGTLLQSSTFWAAISGIGAVIAAVAAMVSVYRQVPVIKAPLPRPPVTSTSMQLQAEGATEAFSEWLNSLDKQFRRMPLMTRRQKVLAWLASGAAESSFYNDFGVFDLFIGLMERAGYKMTPRITERDFARAAKAWQARRPSESGAVSVFIADSTTQIEDRVDEDFMPEDE